MVAATVDSMRPEWHDDFRVEDLLRRVGALWEYRADVTIGDIDTTASLRRQARMSRRGKLDESLVQRYYENMRDGDTFPAVVLIRRREDGRYEALGGNHRIPAAVRAGRRKIAAYVLLTDDPAVVDSVLAQLNEVEGRRTEDPNELVERALQWAEKYHKDIETAAREFRQSADKLRRIRSRRIMQDRMARRRVDMSGLKPTHVDVLGRLSNDNVLAAAVVEVQAAGLSTEETAALVNSALALGTEADQIDAVARFTAGADFARRRSEVARGMGPRRSRTDYTRLCEAMTTIIRLGDRYLTLDAMGANTRQRAEFYARRDEAIRAIARY